MEHAGDCMNATPPHMVGHVLRPEEFLARASYDSAAPDERLSRWVERYWSVTWSLEDGASHHVATLDEPAVNLTVERGGVQRSGMDGDGAWITGPVAAGRFDVTLTGTGSVIGVKFRLGGTTAFRAADLAALRDRTVPAAEWFDVDPAAVVLEPTATEAAEVLDDYLLAREPREDPGFDGFLAVLEMLADPEVTGTGELERRAGMGTRSLQRLFERFVGLGPKRMLVRARVMDAVAAFDSGDPRDVVDLAHDLGWFDQPHFIRDFRAITGETPARYARRRG
ncbi:DUF6597 domain-containing transcriptional factor [Brachybacterium sp. GCM10030268]|uniref:DUF6597 domain-containing transcriptional factor n=2 Tax=unclassified Brachybacterium TaxID=2623841 RepID=UPI0036069624